MDSSSLPRWIIATFLCFGLFYIWNQQNIYSTIKIPTPTITSNQDLAKEVTSKKYGIFHSIAEPLKKGLVYFKYRSGSWALAIILMTIILKVATLPFQYLASKSSKKMRRLQPVLKELREKFKDHPEELRLKTLEAFKESKTNPFMSIVPALLQIPIFIAFYNILALSPDLFSNSIWLWIPSLQAPHPYFILPLLTGLFYFLSQKITGQVIEDKIQKRMTGIIPIIAIAFGLAMPAGVALYLAVSSAFQCVGQFCMEKL